MTALQNVGALTLSRIVLIVANAGMVFLLAAVLDPNDLGMWLAIASWGAVVAAAVDLGRSESLMRHIAALGDHHARATLSSAARTPSIILALSTGAALCTLTIVPSAGSAPFLALLTAMALLLQRFVVAVCRGAELHIHVAFTSGAADRICFAIAVILLPEFNIELNVFTVALVNAAAVTFVSLLTLWLSRGPARATPLTVHRASNAMRYRDTWRLGADGLLNITLAGAGGIAIASIVLNSSDVAQLAMSARLAALVALPLQIGNLYLGPAFARLAATEAGLDNARMRRASIAISASAIGVLAIVVPIAAFAIPLLFGDAFKNVLSLTLLIIVGQLVNVMTGPAGTVLVAIHQDSWLLRSSAIGSTVLLIAVLVFGGAIGVVGAAVGMTIATATVNVLRWFGATANGHRTDPFQPKTGLT